MHADPVGPTLRALRHATAARHAEIEAVLALDRPSTPARYHGVLRGFDAFLAGWEPAVASALPKHLQPWLAARSRRHWLADDLRVLGEHEAPRARAVPVHLPDVASAFGSLYVVEGSALGGQVLCRHLALQGWTPGRGASYFHGHGDATGAMWREFRALLERQTEGEAAGHAACLAAVATFEALIAQMKASL